ncbi:PspC domain-containing protein [Pseudoalteromonas luteoviolacea]|uniref:Phage shock protein PspC N-terminal domain-containing protein n=1 Tax=Pseudoalteromonas luteoviolacea S4054 TaxID=1129367 RepID=A0A0F6AD86_9GAMM|nr:PspC domain-containing protein [Pseudoalteromonas luteoviolacea]AOT09850.1 hypothetical protein S4054249_19355 [Pseudoalteromonas luteoviolacea]AOT14762.1 hypothetical protein S40542_19325 [Pseudoalteromonas luteoviolacea]AOT19677.1 hypothetical protein S4054_19330 [Pseudoalteromonas luteoviolacea]KKE84123.1 hypothetical protein N479_11980 [Pseudoalteromonas luteoviolacea S4054]KZN77517.1 hypothetical protein N481_05520 [Pseudoalteromonas luteoviolacea S4047-1]
MYSNRYKNTQRYLGKKKIAGVCIEVADKVDLPVWLVRLLMVLLALKFTLPCIIGYFIGWLCLTNKDRV